MGGSLVAVGAGGCGLAGRIRRRRVADLDRSQANGYPTIVLPGHSEYWTKAMRDDLDNRVHRDGVNLAVLGGNEIYWQARTQRDSGGRLPGMTVFRDVRLDPTRDPAVTTVLWSMPPVDRDEASLTGQGMSAIGVTGPLQVDTLPGWVRDRAALPAKTVLPMAVGGEGDAVEGPGQHSPPNVQIVLRGVVHSPEHARLVLMSTSYYADPSGAGVFNAGNIEWLCGIQDICGSGPRPPVTRAALTTLTLDAWRAFATPKAGRRYPSRPSAWEYPTQLAPSMPIGGPTH